MQECLYSVPVEFIQQYTAMTLWGTLLITSYSYSIWSVRFMNSYCAGLDVPQVAWACRKYCSHHTLLPNAIGEARACIWINYIRRFHWKLRYIQIQKIIILGSKICSAEPGFFWQLDSCGCTRALTSLFCGHRQWHPGTLSSISNGYILSPLRVA